MLIVCPNCSTSYQLDASVLAPAGRSVRCARCREVWFASPTDEETPAPVATLAETGQTSGTAEAGTPAQGQETGSEAAFDEAASWAEVLNEQSANLDAFASDKQPVATTDSPPLVPDDPLLDQYVGHDVETVAALRHARPSARDRWRQLPLLPILVLLLIAANAAVIHWRADLVRTFPQTASLFVAIGLPVNLRGLDFEDIRVTREENEGVPVLVVEGLIVSISRTPVQVPRLRLSILNERGNEIYAWTTLPSRNILAPEERLPFRTRLASPPAEGREVQVRFFQRQDISAGPR